MVHPVDMAGWAATKIVNVAVLNQTPALGHDPVFKSMDIQPGICPTLPQNCGVAGIRVENLAIGHVGIVTVRVNAPSITVGVDAAILDRDVLCLNDDITRDIAVSGQPSRQS